MALVVLVAVGAFFFTFEDELEEEYFETENQQQSADPYAWAKQKAVPSTPQQPIQQVQQPVQQVQQPVQQQATTSQHPGWIWDVETNQWVPDPDYVHNSNRGDIIATNAKPGVQERILLHLLDYSDYKSSVEVPFSLSQMGIANAVAIARSNVPRAIAGLKDQGLLIERQAHVKGVSEKKKRIS